MITFTANPMWPEIQANVLQGQTGMDRPDVVDRVFKIKLRELLEDLRSKVFNEQRYVRVNTRHGAWCMLTS